MSQLPPPPPPPPPPGTPPPGPPAGDFAVGDAVSYGWTTYWRNVGPLVVMTLIILAVNVVIGLIGSAVNSSAGTIVVNLLSFIVGIVLAMGLIRAAIAVVEGRTPEANMFLNTDGFASYLGAVILFALAVVGPMIILAILVPILVLVWLIPAIVLGVMWHFFGYVIVEDPAVTPSEALRRSADITRGHRWQLFGLGVLLALINIVGFLACFIGLLFTYGITAVTLAYAYKRLSGQPVAMA